MQIGLHASMVEGGYTLPEAIEKSAELGADVYEIDIGIGDPGVSWSERHRSWETAKVETRRVAERVGIGLPSICLGVLWQYSLASDDESERLMGVQIVRDCAGLASYLGAEAMLLPIGQPKGLGVERAQQNVIDSIERCIDRAEAENVTLAIENVCQEVLRTADDLIRVVDAVGSKRCGVYFDPGNQTFIGIDPVPELEELGERVVRVHAKDTVAVERPSIRMPKAKISGDFDVWKRRTTVELGTGDLDWPAIQRAIEGIGYQGPVIIEVSQAPESIERGCRANIAAAKRIFAGDRAS